MRVLIVDDHPIVASGCRAVLAGEPEIVLLEASDAESGERAFTAEHPDICVIDINLPTVSGFELALRLNPSVSAAFRALPSKRESAFLMRNDSTSSRLMSSRRGVSDTPLVRPRSFAFTCCPWVTATSAS